MQNCRFKQNIRNSISGKQPRGARFNISEKAKKRQLRGPLLKKLQKDYLLQSRSGIKHVNMLEFMKSHSLF